MDVKMDDIHTHLNDMDLSYEFLSGMGVTIYDEDYVSMVLMSLPDSYTTHLETLTDTTISSGHTFTTQDFISKAIEAFRQVTAAGQPQPQVGPENFHFSVIGVPQQREEKQLT